VWHDLGAALALLLVLEGIFPFVSPGAMRRALATIGELSDAQLRVAGFVSMLLGLVLLYIVNR
jgi:uncharacterized protein YjeT (DUF2065 family)